MKLPGTIFFNISKIGDIALFIQKNWNLTNTELNDSWIQCNILNNNPC